MQNHNEEFVPALKDTVTAQKLAYVTSLNAETTKKSYDVRAKVCSEFQLLVDGIIRSAMAKFRFEVADVVAQERLV